MNRNELIKYIYDLNFVQAYVRKLCNSVDWLIVNDLEQECWLQICEVSEDKWQQLLAQGTTKDAFKGVRGYISGLIYRNIKSVNSRAYSHLKKFAKKEILTTTGEITDETFYDA